MTNTVALNSQQALPVRIIGRGQPVLMLPGLGMSSAHWLPFVLPHRRRFRFYLPDFRGQGRAAHLRFTGDDVFESHADDVEQLARHFGLQDIFLVGYSLGATTSLHWLQRGGFSNVRRYLHIDQSPCVGNRDGWSFGLAGERQAELVARMREVLALLESFPDVDHVASLPQPARTQLAALLTDMLRLLGNEARKRKVLGALLAKGPAWLLRALPLLDLSVLRAYLTAYSGGGHDYRAALQQSHADVTAFIGMKSPLYHPDGQALVADSAASGRVVRFERSGHVPLLSEPVKFMREFGRFLNG